MPDIHLVRALKICIVQLLLVFWKRQASILPCSTMLLLVVSRCAANMTASDAYAAATDVSNNVEFTGLQVQTLDVLRPQQLILFV